MVIDEIFRVVEQRKVPIPLLARRSGYWVQSVHKWRKKERTPSILVVDDLLDALDLKIILRRKPRA